MAAEFGRTSYLLLLVGLLGLFVWNTRGQSCSSQAECEPNVVCEFITWYCNGSTSLATTTAAPTPDPLSLRCCQHLGSCGDDTIVAGWVSVRNTTIKMGNSEYSVEWLDTFITQGNATLPAVIKSAYVGSWSTLRNVAMEFPSQMFVAEPTNSCTVDGEPKWPEWYQVTVNIMAENNMDDTLEIEDRREKQCLCDIVFDCINSVCEVKTENLTNSTEDFGMVDANIAEDVELFCQENLTAINYTASSYFAVGFEPKNAELNTWQLNASVEAGWAPELDDDDMWIKIHLPQDMMVSGLITQGVGLNAERRVDQFKLEYDVSDAASGPIAANKIFKAGARLDTKLTNYFPKPVKANAIKITVIQPCDPYYVGLRVQLIGCPTCVGNGDCVTYSNGECLPEKFCTYKALTTTAETTTTSITTAQTTKAQTTEAQTTKAQTTKAQTTKPETTKAPTTKAQTQGKTTAATAGTTSSTLKPTAANADTTITAGASTKVTQEQTDSIATTKQTTKAGTIPSTLTAEETTTVKASTESITSPVATSSPVDKSETSISTKINEVTASLDGEVAETLNNLILPTNLSSTDPVNITKEVIETGLEVIRNITTVANTTQDKALQKTILEGCWNFMTAVSKNEDSFVSEDNKINEDLFKEFIEVGGLVLHKDRKDAWQDIQEETVVGPIGIVVSIEDVAIQLGQSLTKQVHASTINISADSLDGIIAVRSTKSVKAEGYSTTFPKEENAQATVVTIDSSNFKDNEAIKGLAENSSLVVVVIQFRSIQELLVTNDAEDKTPGNNRLASNVLSIQVVAGGEPQSVPLTFQLGHSEAKEKETSKCNFWEAVHSSKTAGNWSDEGCTKLKSTSSEFTQCKCDHMTNFGVLMWLGEEEKLPDGTLETISQVGCFVSISALAVALGLLLYLKSALSSERIIIHIHLMSVTLVALVLFVFGISSYQNKVVCKLITIALHFFFMAMFSWMLVEGIHLYRQVISVFDSEKSRMWVYFAVGWGIPVVVVTIGISIFIGDYGENENCWLNPEDSIWVFMGPIIPTIAVNLVVLIMVSRIVMSASKLQQEQPAFKSVKAGLRSSFLLLPIMGVTWIFGYFQTFGTVFSYAFTVLNSFQGFFMALFHCFMSTEVNNALKQKIKRVKDSSIGGGSTMDSQSHKPAMFTSGIRKVKVSPSQTDDTDGF